MCMSELLKYSTITTTDLLGFYYSSKTYKIRSAMKKTKQAKFKKIALVEQNHPYYSNVRQTMLINVYFERDALLF